MCLRSLEVRVKRLSRLTCLIELLFVAGSSVFTIREHADPANETLAVMITRDDQVERPVGWRPDGR